MTTKAIMRLIIAKYIEIGTVMIITAMGAILSCTGFVTQTMLFLSLAFMMIAPKTLLYWFAKSELYRQQS